MRGELLALQPGRRLVDVLDQRLDRWRPVLLLGRDDLLAKDSEPWQYPRVQLTDTEKDLWHWGTFLGMPLLFVYTGFLVFMVRRMR